MNMFLRGYECLQFKDYANGYRIFHELYEKGNHSVEVAFNLGLCYIVLENHQKATMLFGDAYQQLQQGFDGTILRDANHKKLMQYNRGDENLRVPIPEGYSGHCRKQVRIRILQILFLYLNEAMSEEQTNKYQMFLEKELA